MLAWGFWSILLRVDEYGILEILESGGAEYLPFLQAFEEKCPTPVPTTHP
jgi:hypothetical protein